MPLDHSAQVTAVVLIVVFASGIIITLGIVGMQLRAKLQAIDVLKIYAERGEEPPAGVIEAVNQIGRPPPPPPPRRVSRAEHLTHVAGSAVLASGAAGIFLWRALRASADLDLVMMVAMVVAIFFAGATAARLVAANMTRDGGQ